MNGSMQHFLGNPPLLSFDDWYNATHTMTVEYLFGEEPVASAMHIFFHAQREYSQYVADYINSNGARKP